MEVLYISALSSERIVEEMHQKSGKNPGYAVQKFSRLLIKGLQKNNVEAIALSNTGFNRQFDKRFWICNGIEIEDGVKYKYIPFINFPIIKHVCVIFYTFVYVLIWGLWNGKEKTIICDVLSISACMAALLATKINRLRCVGVVTDLYGLSADKIKKRGIQGALVKLACRINKKYISAFTHYVLLTEEMNEVVNPHRRPYIVMEGICDSTITDKQIKSVIKSEPKTVLYAGGLYEIYGLEMLVQAFISMNRNDAKLVLYGSGPYVEKLKQLNHPYVEYRGVAPNKDVVKAEMEATLLINPRFTTEEFTKYSFPSKNMEYMTTGTPLITTKLQGMPKEYYQHVFLIEDESIAGFAQAISSALDMPSEALIEMGRQAREFVLINKNNGRQAKRVLMLANNRKKQPFNLKTHNHA